MLPDSDSFYPRRENALCLQNIVLHGVCIPFTSDEINDGGVAVKLKLSQIHTRLEFYSVRDQEYANGRENQLSSLIIFTKSSVRK